MNKEEHYSVKVEFKKNCFISAVRKDERIET